jgi:acyl-coenzyme A synthetase/AMP-(fatty) acid ligase
VFLNADKHSPEHLAFRDNHGGSVTYAELLGFTKVCACAVPARELVFCLCKNTVASAAGYYAFYENRDVALLLDAALPSEMLTLLVNEYSPAYIWLPDDMDFCGEPALTFGDYHLIKTGLTSPLLNDALSFLLATSGSTGSSKLVRHKYGNLEHNAEVVSEAFEWDENERGICQLPMHYTMGLSVINSILNVGGTALLCDAGLASGEFWDFFKAEQATSFTGVPFSYEILLKMRFQKMNLPHLKTICCGGGKLSEENFKKLADYASATGCRFFSTFGATETSARCAYLFPDLAGKKLLSVGKAFRDGELLLTDENGQIISDIEAEGELVYRGKNVTMGYSETRDDLVKGDEWHGEYTLGDVAKRDRDGCYYIVGRISRFLKIYGRRISLDTTETLVGLRFRTDCVCAGTDTKMEIFVTIHGAEHDIIQLLVDKTTLPKTAFAVVVVDEIPRMSNGKVDYIELRREQNNEP